VTTTPCDFIGRPLKAGQTIIKGSVLSGTCCELEFRKVHSVVGPSVFLIDRRGQKGGKAITPERVYIVKEPEA